MRYKGQISQITLLSHSPKHRRDNGKNKILVDSPPDLASQQALNYLLQIKDFTVVACLDLFNDVRGERSCFGDLDERPSMTFRCRFKFLELPSVGENRLLVPHPPCLPTTARRP